MQENKSDQIRKKEIFRVTLIGSLINAILLTLKFFAGIVGNSAAMIADAVHSLSDFATDLVVLLFVQIASKPKDENHDYGHGKYETFATMIIGATLAVVGLGIFWEGSQKIYAALNGKQLEAPGTIALYAAAASIVAKELLYWYTLLVGKKVQSNAVIANAWHHRSDAFSSIGTLIGIGGAIFLGPDWRILDPIASVVVSIFIVKVAIKLFIPNMNELLEESLPRQMREQIIQIIQNIEGVTDPHNLKTRRINNQAAIEVHVRMKGDQSLHEAHVRSQKIEQALRSQFGERTHITIHYEPVK